MRFVLRMHLIYIILAIYQFVPLEYQFKYWVPMYLVLFAKSNDTSSKNVNIRLQKRYHKLSHNSLVFLGIKQIK